MAFAKLRQRGRTARVQLTALILPPRGCQWDITNMLYAKNARSSYVREFALSYVDFDKIEPKLEDGVLKIVVPKTAESKTKYIEVK